MNARHQKDELKARNHLGKPKTRTREKIRKPETDAGSEEEDISTAEAMQNLGRDIRDIKTALKLELTDFKNDLRQDMKQEFNSF